MKNDFTRMEIRFLIAMGMVLGMRELSMTMLNPFITIYGRTLKGNTIFLCGIAMGIYGLTNGFFQIPYGLLSDKFGRKPVILVGLLQLCLGLFISFLTSNIYIFILARALQGSGAVMAIAYAWLGDSIEDSKKSRAMGIAGVIVALGAVIAFSVGPMLIKIISLKVMFLGCSFIILFSALFILFFIKEDKKEIRKNNGDFKLVLRNKSVLKLSMCGFIYNFVMSSMFFIVPSYLSNTIGTSNMWMVFTPAVLIGIFSMVKASKLADKGYFKVVSIFAFALLTIGSLCFAFINIFFYGIGSILVISGFMILTSGIPSAVNKEVSDENRGSANGILQTMTFLGFFAGPTLTGYLLDKVSLNTLQMIPSLLSILGIFILTKNMKVNVERNF